MGKFILGVMDDLIKIIIRIVSKPIVMLHDLKIRVFKHKVKHTLIVINFFGQPMSVTI